jgi:hypothetical protein
MRLLQAIKPSLTKAASNKFSFSKSDRIQLAQILLGTASVLGTTTSVSFLKRDLEFSTSTNDLEYSYSRIHRCD